MKYSILLFIIVYTVSCTHQSGTTNSSKSDPAFADSIHGIWRGFDKKPFWNITNDSVYYYNEQKSYYYFLHDRAMVVLYKNGPFEIRNFRFSGDSIFCKIGSIDAVVFKSWDKSQQGTDRALKKIDPPLKVSTADILGKWEYKHAQGIFSWVFSKDSVSYLQLRKKYFYVRHDDDIIVLTQPSPTILKNVRVNSDTISFMVSDTIKIKAHKVT